MAPGTWLLHIDQMWGDAVGVTQPVRASLATWAGFGALCLGMFMAILDVQVVVTSLSVIQVALDIGAERMSWVQTSYLIAEIIAIPLTALLTRVFSMRLLFAAATVVFTLASIACAASFDSACDYELEASHTYILQSETNSRPFYTGCTTDRNRLAPHNSSDVPHTSKSNSTRAKAFRKSA